MSAVILLIHSRGGEYLTLFVTLVRWKKCKGKDEGWEGGKKLRKIWKVFRSKIDKLGVRRLDYWKEKEKGTGTWLAATPNTMCGTVLSAI